MERAGHPDPAGRPDAAELCSALMASAASFARPEPLRLAGFRIDLDAAGSAGDAEVEPTDMTYIGRAPDDDLTDHDGIVVVPDADDRDAEDRDVAGRDVAGRDVEGRDANASDTDAATDAALDTENKRDGMAASGGSLSTSAAEPGTPVSTDDADASTGSDPAAADIEPGGPRAIAALQSASPVRNWQGRRRQRLFTGLPFKAPGSPLDGDSTRTGSAPAGSGTVDTGRSGGTETGSSAARSGRAGSGSASRGRGYARSSRPGTSRHRGTSDGPPKDWSDRARSALLSTSGFEAGGRGATGVDGRSKGGETTGSVPPIVLDEEGSRRGLVVLVALLVLVLLGGGVYWGLSLRTPYFAVPELVGKEMREVDALTAGNGWRVVRETRFDDVVPSGHVIDQDPAAPTDIAHGGTLTITVSSGRPPVPVPATLIGQSLNDAGTALNRVGLGVGSVKRVWDERSPAETVISLEPGTPAEVLKGSAVDLIVSSGPEPRTIPDGLIGDPANQVTATLQALGLNVKREDGEFNDFIPKGNVVSVQPGAGQKVPKGSTITLSVSKGPDVIVIPPVAGMSVDQAASTLVNAGLIVSGTQGSPLKSVIGTDPVAGAIVRRGWSVKLITE